ncbi:WD repeat protein [Arthroderma uncinatum]|uniref:WD repeat protein n=1 Tax=Arthroderma uncinatum TaxID=74035 RepID=UPI00144AB1E6|nr:WD repeat protein [Arthroderma uncinatum]KAF3479557.1 WD repeat protein [Arthroderma uncinatum]
MTSRAEARSSRRPRRATTQPINYFAPIPGFAGYEYDEEEQESSAPEPMIYEPPPPQLPSPATKRSIEITRPRVLYRSQTRSIIREPLNPVSPGHEPLLEDDNADTELPYSSAERRRKSGELLSLTPIGEEGIIFHVDFSKGEMSAVYSFLTGQVPPDDDIPLQDHLFNATRFLNTESMNRRVRRLRELNDVLPSGFELGDLFIPVSIEGDIPKSFHRTVKRIGKIFGHSVEKYQAEGYRKMVEKIGHAAIADTIRECKALSGLNWRNSLAISTFVVDAQAGMLSSIPSRLAAYPTTTFSPQVHSVCSDIHLPSALLRSRALGYTRYRGRNPVNGSLRDIYSQKWELWKTWTGASHDVMALSWAPDGTRFVAGTTAHCEENNMQYNRNNNLLLGDLAMESIKELPDHRIPRPLITTGEFANQSTFNTLGPNLYMTISAVQWSGDRLFTASYDKTVKVWNLQSEPKLWETQPESDECESQPKLNCTHTLYHPEKLEVMSVSNLQGNLIATGCQDAKPIRIWSERNDTYDCLPLKTFSNLMPSSLVWGTNPSCADLLVTGLSRKGLRTTFSSTKCGTLVLWQVEKPNVSVLGEWEMSQHISDIKWHPSQPIFMVGCSTPTAIVRLAETHDRSFLRFYDPVRSKHEVNSFHCPALDINEVTFCPLDDNYVTASCTDNLTYVWDRRNPSHILHKLGHGKPLNQLSETVPQEEDDTGVCMAVWGGPNFYTGGSDGIVKCWDVRRSSNELVVDEIATFGHGIMSGALSPDQTNMVVGDSSGSIHILSTAPFSHKNGQNLVYEEAPIDTRNGADYEISGILESKKLLESGQLTRHPTFGVGQGACYDGPYAGWARPAGTQPDDMSITPLEPNIQALQLDGPPISERSLLTEERQSLVLKHVTLATTRNKRSTSTKSPRKRAHLETPRRISQKPRDSPREIIDISSDESDAVNPKRTRRLSLRQRSNATPMTSSPSRSRNFQVKSEPMTPSPSKLQGLRMTSKSISPQKSICIDLTADTSDGDFSSSTSVSSFATCVSDVKGHITKDDDLDEEDYWWPYSADVIELANQ